eukprot:3797186-Alexandrium_andersonii.AAC.1
MFGDAPKCAFHLALEAFCLWRRVGRRPVWVGGAVAPDSVMGSSTPAGVWPSLAPTSLQAE